MIVQYHKLALTAALMLAITFTLSCSSPDDDNGGGGSSSPSSGGNSSDSGVSPGPCPNAVTGDGTLSCGGQTYGTVVIGYQTWMAKNLNYKVSGSKCYGNAESDCNKYGRLYDWETARVVCPSGWHLPSYSDWGELISYVESDSGCKDCAGQHLKSKSGWNSGGNGTDTYGFSALPGGTDNACGTCSSAGYGGNWWTATESYNSFAYDYYMNYYSESVGINDNRKTDLYSVRCLKD